MLVYSIVLITILFIAVLMHSKQFSNNRKALLSTACIVLFAVSGLRFYVGTDYSHYISGFSRYVNSTTMELLRQPAIILVAKITHLISDDYAIWFFAMAMITVIPVFIGIYKYSVSIALSMILYLLLGCWHFSFNIVKQSAAAAFLFLGYGALRSHNLKRWIIFCAVATLFHFSAILMIPVFYVVAVPKSKRNSAIIIGLSISILFFYDRLFILASLLKQGENTISIYSATRNNAVNILRIAVNCAPLLLCALSSQINDKTDLDYNTLFNLSLLNAGMNIGTMNSIYLNRICVYTTIYNVLFIPVIIKRISSRNRMICIPIMLLLYIVFWWYDLYKGSATVVYHWVFER